MEQPIENPYKKGKAKLIAELIIEGWNNEKIYNHITDNKLDARFTNPVTMNGIYKVRTRFKQLGLTEKLAQRAQKAVPTTETTFQEEPIEVETPKVLYDSRQQGEVPDLNGKTIRQFPPVGRPEWDLLTTDQINKIKDPETRTLILEYKSYREKIKQEVTPDYATKEQFDGFKAEIQESLGVIMETLNKMQTENPKNPEVAIADVEVAEVSDPTIDLETENPLDDAVESVIELEGSIISRKTVGFTPKSLMLYDLTRKKGFRGNFADFVNSCITSALKGRNFKLTVVEDVP